MKEGNYMISDIIAGILVVSLTVGIPFLMLIQYAAETDKQVDIN